MRALQWPELLRTSVFEDERGSLHVIDNLSQYSMVGRSYWFTSSPEGGVRGGHAHKSLKQIFICLQGSFKIIAKSHNEVREFRVISGSEDVVFFPMGLWREIVPLEKSSIMLVLASSPYSEGDYIRNFEGYVSWLQQ